MGPSRLRRSGKERVAAGSRPLLNANNTTLGELDSFLQLKPFGRSFWVAEVLAVVSTVASTVVSAVVSAAVTILVVDVDAGTGSAAAIAGSGVSSSCALAPQIGINISQVSCSSSTSSLHSQPPVHTQTSQRPQHPTPLCLNLRPQRGLYL